VFNFKVELSGEEDIDMAQLNKRENGVTFLKTASLGVFLGSLLGVMPSMAQQPGFTLYSWNVSRGLNKVIVRNQIMAMQPDVILVEEADNDAEVSLLQSDLETRLGGTWQVLTNSLTGSSKLAWLSRYPLTNSEIIKTGYIQKALLKAQVEVGNEVFTLVGLHARTASPHSIQAAESDTFLSIIKTKTNHFRTIVVGDFNSRSVLDGAVTSLGDTTYDSLGFSYPTTYSTDNFAKAGYLDSWRLIKGELTNVEATKMPPTSETSGSNLNERIDYIFISSDLSSHLLDAGIHFETTNVMSDHKPIWVRIAANGVSSNGGVQANPNPTIKSSTLATDNSFLEIQFTEGVYANLNQTGALTMKNFELTFERHANGQATSCSIKAIEHTPGSDRAKIYLTIKGIPNGNETLKVHLAGQNISAQTKPPRHLYNMTNADYWSRIYLGKPFASTVRTNYHRLNLVPSIPISEALTVNIEQATYQTDPINKAAPVFFTVTFNRPVVDFTAKKLSLRGDARANAVILLKETDTQYVVIVKKMKNKGTVILNLPAGVVHDAQGKANQLSTSNDNVVTNLDDEYEYIMNSAPER